MPKVNLDGHFADEEFASDLLVREPIGYVTKHLTLAPTVRTR